MDKTLVICGDSFNIGIGCENMYTEPYGVLVSEHFGWNLITLARGSASNYAVFLQGLYAAEIDPKPHLVVISQTSYDRLEWVVEGKKSYHNNTLYNLNYHQYPPHHHPQPHHNGPLPFHLQNDPKYDPYIVCEQIGAIDQCAELKRKNKIFDYYARLDKEPAEKLELITKYYVDIFDHSIKRDYDIGLITQAYYAVKRKGIQCIILTYDEKFKNYVDEKDILHVDWGQLSLKYPDTIQSFHTSALGHAEVAHYLIKKIAIDGRYD